MKINVSKILILLVSSALLCSSCNSNTNNRNINENKTNNATAKPKATVSGTKSPESSLDDNNKYYYEPSKSIIEGTVITRMYYGPPNYGEDPENDTKEYPFILKLDNPIRVIAKAGDSLNSDKFDIKEVQIVPMNENDIIKVKQSKNKRIKIQGTFYSALTGHHHTDVLISVEKFLD